MRQQLNEIAVYSHKNNKLVGLVILQDDLVVKSMGVHIPEGASKEQVLAELDKNPEWWAVEGDLGDYKLGQGPVLMGEGADYANAKWHADPWADSKS